MKRFLLSVFMLLSVSAVATPMVRMAAATTCKMTDIPWETYYAAILYLVEHYGFSLDGLIDMYSRSQIVLVPTPTGYIVELSYVDNPWEPRKIAIPKV